jgi:hypothetical protein
VAEWWRSGDGVEEEGGRKAQVLRHGESFAPVPFSGESGEVAANTATGSAVMAQRNANVAPWSATLARQPNRGARQPSRGARQRRSGATESVHGAAEELRSGPRGGYFENRPEVPSCRGGVPVGRDRPFPAADSQVTPIRGRPPLAPSQRSPRSWIEVPSRAPSPPLEEARQSPRSEPSVPEETSAVFGWDLRVCPG